MCKVCQKEKVWNSWSDFLVLFFNTNGLKRRNKDIDKKKKLAYILEHKILLLYKYLDKKRHTNGCIFILVIAAIYLIASNF